MAINSPTNIWEYIGNGVVNTFNYTQPISNTTDLVVTRVNLDDTTDTLVNGTDYTVNGAGNPNSSTWNIVTTATPATGIKIVITLNIPKTQINYLSSQTGYSPQVVEQSLDKLTLIALDLQQQVDRKIGVDVGSDVTPAALLASIEAAEASSVAAAAAAQTAETNAETAQTNAESAATAAAASAVTAANNPIDIGHRLTLTSGTPVISSVTAATTLYLTQYKSNTIHLYSGSAWVKFNVNEVSLSLSGLAANTNFDIFAYNNAGTVTLEATAWTNDTTRATALVRQDGIWVKSGATTRRYVGTIRTTGTTGQCEFTTTGSGSGGFTSRRFVWNYYNRLECVSHTFDTTDSWTYGTQTWRAANNSSTHRHQFVVGMAEDYLESEYQVIATIGSTSLEVWNGIGYDSTSAPIGNSRRGNLNWNSAFSARLPMSSSLAAIIPALGYHYLAPLEMASTGTAATFYGDNGTGELLSSFYSSIVC